MVSSLHTFGRGLCRRYGEVFKQDHSPLGSIRREPLSTRAHVGAAPVGGAGGVVDIVSLTWLYSGCRLLKDDRVRGNPPNCVAEIANLVICLKG